MNIDQFITLLFAHQTRKNGDPASAHFYAVRALLRDAGITDPDVLQAALLHDVLEDTHLPKHYLAKHFGQRVADLVDAVSKLKTWNTAYCRMKGSLDEIESVFGQQPEAMLIKLADRIDNIRTIDGFSLAKQQTYLAETKNLLLPLFQQYRSQLGQPGEHLLDQLLCAVEQADHSLLSASAP